MKEIKLFIFDLDGVITSTDRQHFLAWSQLVEKLNLVMNDEINQSLKGISRKESFLKILKYNDKENLYSDEKISELIDLKNIYYKKLIESFDKSNVFPGVVELFEKLKDKGIKIAIASASQNAPRLLERMDLMNYIDYVVNPSEVANGKPHPDIFLRAANELNIKPQDCVGLEDAFAGIEAINSAGMISVGIGNESELPEADYIYNSVEEIDLKDLFNKIKSAFPILL